MKSAVRISGLLEGIDMITLDRMGFLIAFAEAVRRYRKLRAEHKVCTVGTAADLATEVGLAPDSGLGVRNDIAKGIEYFGDLTVTDFNAEPGLYYLHARSREEAAWNYYQRLLAAQPKTA